MTGPASDSMPAVLAEQLAHCIRCGLCLPACPTYEIFRTEMDAPRGRLRLMRAAWEDPDSARRAASKHLDLCLGCLSCETACPSGVEYGSLLHSTRRRLAETRPGWSSGRLLRRLLVAMLGHRGLLHALSWVVSLKQRLGVIAIGQRLPLPTLLARALALLPAPVSRFRPPATVVEATAPPRGRVALFRGCVQDAFLGRVNAATVRLLTRSGWEVVFPPTQTCCGAAALHVGEDDLARALARRNLAAFASSEVEAIVTNAGGCSAMLTRYGELFPAHSEAAAAAAHLASRVRDVSELLAQAPADSALRPVACRAVYADSCHLRHIQGIFDPPRRLLQAIPGLELAELERPDHCCGSAGVFNLAQGETADRVLERKLGEIERSGASIVVTSNPGCQLQLLQGIRRAGLAAEVVHLVELLERSHGATD